MKELTFYNLEEMERYYNKEANTYCFLSESGETISKINIMFNLKINSSILANDIDCLSLKVKDLNVWNIDSLDLESNQIIAHNIDCTTLTCNKLIVLNKGTIKTIGKVDISCIICESTTNW